MTSQQSNDKPTDGRRHANLPQDSPERLPEDSPQGSPQTAPQGATDPHRDDAAGQHGQGQGSRAHGQASHGQRQQTSHAAEAPEVEPAPPPNGTGQTQSPAEQELARLADERDQLHQRLMRVSADYQNYVRRAQQNAEQVRDQTTADLVKALLTVLDHFDHALGAGEKEEVSARDLLTGVRMVRDELLKTLESFGVERVDVRPGEPFNPNRHNAMMQQEAEGIESQHVVSQMQPGYSLGNRVIRPAKVAVAP